RDAQLIDYQTNLEDMVQTRTEELQLAKEEAESANQAKSDFLATVSHEIRTPMNGIMIMTELMAEASTTGRQRRYANIIRQSGAGMLAIINDILDLSKIEAGKMDLNLAEIEPDDVIVGVASLLWESANSRSVDLSCYISSRVPEKIVADPIRLSQIITNLVGNAIKFTSDGSVEIEVDIVKSIDANRTRLRFEVTDTGVGISADRIDSIFDRFEQADTSTVRDYGGTGLGLSICKKLADAMDGVIGVDSEPGRGSTFWFEIEVESSPANMQQVNAPGGLSGQDHKCLALVCRSNATRLALAKGLEELGHKVSSLDEIAMTTAISGGFDAILCEPADAMKIRCQTHQIPVIVLTNMGDNEQELRKAMPISEILFLPCGRRQLRELGLEVKIDIEEKPITDKTGEISSFTGLNVLGVDDNLVNRTVLRDALVRLGASVDLASSGSEALKAIGRKRYDLVFMDCSMPDMDGFETTAAIRAQEDKTSAAALPIIALTAHLSGPEAEQWQDVGMDGYLAKPFTMESLSQALLNVVSGRDDCEGEPVPNEEFEKTAEKKPLGDGHLIDPKTLELLSSLGSKSGTSAASRIFGLYVGTAGPALKTISAMIKEGSAPKLARTVHNFKSMSLSSGACAVATIAEEMEMHAKNGETRRAGQLLGELEAIYLRTKDVMNELIRDQENESPAQNQPSS
ncbi:MAG: ATP-binding protein, partial [Pseudomonadota bacterium]